MERIYILDRWRGGYFKEDLDFLFNILGTILILESEVIPVDVTVIIVFLIFDQIIKKSIFIGRSPEFRRRCSRSWGDWCEGRVVLDSWGSLNNWDSWGSVNNWDSWGSLNNWDFCGIILTCYRYISMWLIYERQYLLFCVECSSGSLLSRIKTPADCYHGHVQSFLCNPLGNFYKNRREKVKRCSSRRTSADFSLYRDPPISSAALVVWERRFVFLILFSNCPESSSIISLNDHRHL